MQGSEDSPKFRKGESRDLIATIDHPEKIKLLIVAKGHSHPSEGHVAAGRCFGTRESKGQDSSFSQVMKSQYMKPQISLA
jgi:hypothetical protein